MKTTLALAFLLPSLGLLPAQTPAPAKPAEVKPAAQGESGKPAPKQEPGKQDPAPASGAQGKQEPKPSVGPDGKPKPTTEEQKIERPPADAPMPKGSDPADLKAMQSAQDMLEAEKRLAQLIKEGKITGLDKIVTFDELSNWPYQDGLKGMPKRVKELHGKKVMMTGFMLPIDEVQNIKEFLLVQSLWSCCYGQPPDVNGIIRVVMPKGKTTDYFFDPLKLIGTLKVEATMIDGFCVDIYQLELDSLESLKTK